MSRASAPVRWLQRHDAAEHLAVTADDVAVWLTGQSSFVHSRLSPAQDAVLDALADEGWTTLRAGLPWTAAAVARPYRAEPLLLASVRNAAQWRAARTDPAFGDDVARHLRPLLERTRRRLLVLCGSAGAQILTAGLGPPAVASPGASPGITSPGITSSHDTSSTATLPTITVVALGPVGDLPSGVALHVVRGRTDLLSRWGCRRPSDTVVRGGHLAYARSPDVLRVVLDVARAARGTAP